MPWNAVTAQQQDDDDLSSGARASDAARQPESAEPAQPRRPPAPGGRVPGAAGSRARPRAAQRRSTFLSLPSGPPVLTPRRPRTRKPGATTPSKLRDLLAAVGFGPSGGARPEAIWRPASAFAGACAAVVLLAYAVADRHLGRVVLTHHAVLGLAVALLVVTLAVTAALTLATNEAGRTLALGAGGMGVLICAAFILVGPPQGIAVTILCLLGLGLGARQSIHTVADGAVHITALPGGRQRTLLPGLNLLLPGERVLVVLSTRPRTYQSLPELARLPDGQPAEAALAVQYALLPERAQRAIAATREWERPLRRRISVILREELAGFLAESQPVGTPSHERTSAQAASSTGEAAVRELRARIERRLRREAHDLGVNILALDLLQVTLPEAVRAYWRTAPSAGALAADRAAAPSLPAQPAPAPREPAPSTLADPSSPATPAFAPALAGTPAPTVPLTSLGPDPHEAAQAYLSSLQDRFGGMVQGWRRFLGPHPAPEEDPGGPEPVPPAAPRLARSPETGRMDNRANRMDAQARAGAADPPMLSARTIGAMYEAVEEGRISDPETIRSIAQALGQYVPSPEDDAVLTFDPHEAGREFLRRLAQQAQPAAVENDPPASGDGPADSAPSRPDARPPQPPRDDNILRGG